MKKETLKKPRKTRVTLLTVFQDERIFSIQVLRKPPEGFVYLIQLKEGFAVCNLFRDKTTTDFAVSDLSDVSGMMQYYFQEVPF